LVRAFQKGRSACAERLSLSTPSLTFVDQNMPTDALGHFIESPKQAPGVVAIVVGGSKARGTADTLSDTDLGLYYDRQSLLKVGAPDAVAAECDDRRCAGLVTAIGEWGQWINGGGWLRMDGHPIDLLYRETTKTEAVLDDAINRRIEIAYQPGHPFAFYPRSM
jgi:Nucleotidyltransferase domain